MILRKKYQLVMVLFVILALMVILKVKYGYNGTNETISPTIPTVAPTIKIIKEDQDYGLWDKLPYTGTGFIVEKYTDKKTLLVTVKGVDKKIALNGIGEWLKENKVDPTKYKIVFEE